MGKLTNNEIAVEDCAERSEGVCPLFWSDLARGTTEHLCTLGEQHSGKHKCECGEEWED